MENYRPIPVSDFVIPNDALLNTIFSVDYVIPAGKRVGFPVTDVKSKKLFTALYLENQYQRAAVFFDEFARAVFDAYISIRAAGNDYTTFDILYRLLGGNDSGHHIPAAARKRIMVAFDMMYHIEFTAEMAATAEGTKYDLPPQIEGKILSFAPVDTCIRGHKTRAVKLADSPAAAVAMKKNQVIRVPADVLDIPVRHTERVIAVKHYLARRIAEITGDARRAAAKDRKPRMTPVITFDDLFRRCRIDATDARKRQIVRETTCDILGHFVGKNFARGFELVKSGDVYHGVQILPEL